MSDIFINIVSLIDDLLFWRRKKKRRKFEKENNLPNKVMIQPMTIIIISLFGILIILKLIISIIK